MVYPPLERFFGRWLHQFSYQQVLFILNISRPGVHIFGWINHSWWEPVLVEPVQTSLCNFQDCPKQWLRYVQLACAFIDQHPCWFEIFTSTPLCWLGYQYHNNSCYLCQHGISILHSCNGSCSTAQHHYASLAWHIWYHMEPNHTTSSVPSVDRYLLPGFASLSLYTVRCHDSRKIPWQRVSPT